ncbi:membrane protein insertase YidC [Pedobacter glucosidilyticus]|nr:membrane protein insertase YidC [Pedobacter glucosidilyticus]KHJ38020.1 membrane protein insertase YidC [Pedobacter glucosidilyticus]
MDRNTFTGLFLILVILVGSTFLLKPSEEQLKREEFVQDSIAKSKKGVKQPTVVAKTTATLPTDTNAQNLSVEKEEILTLENDKIKVFISTLGGKVSSVELKNETNQLNQPVVLFNKQNNFAIEYSQNNQNLNTSNLFFAKEAVQDNKLVLKATQADGSFVSYTYTLAKESNKVDFNISLSGFQNKVNADKGLTINWAAELQQQEKDINNERIYSTTYFKIANDDVDYLSETESEEKSFTEETLAWVSFKQHFFSAALMSKDGFTNSTLKVQTIANNSAVKAYQAKLNLPFKNQQVNNYELEYYFGSNKFSQLREQGNDLEKQVKMGWGPLKWINRYLVLPVFNFFEGFNVSYGIIILLLTIILKTVLFPFTYKSYLSMAKMRVLKPEMDEIKKKVGDDNPTLLQQEYLKLYKQAGVNPLGGCLPLLFQMPFILAFFYFFPNLFELRHESFLWMKDLSTYDELITFAPIPLLGWSHISLMCLLMTISTLIYTYFNNQVSGAQGQMKYIGYITPIIFFGVLNAYPAGLNYYYFCANILTFAQQYLIRYFVDDEKIHAQIQEFKKKPESAKKKSGFQKKLEDMMRQQQQFKEQQKKKK